MCLAFSATAQTNPEIAKGTIKMEMLFLEGKSKAKTYSAVGRENIFSRVHVILTGYFFI